ncbi:Uncharacterized protein OS=Chamaesiphon minutus PCC 6605 GN=Cha6605_2846 PE=4 SV=1 [Gemmataceae bacterium]|nr:Uncharacterized protein OS=Chamaesiphon minutus PCC 6605 GN=Cha6605_2846 PE=4 SV=1 [Gemmataceae bacterium]VTT98060.1 Uncharacterized protein OS=Chamaesiphon minutus PCC 6605 GN=Cha6605_2846 PE=4 SV=1 [Gemmataceae bacterium]
MRASVEFAHGVLYGDYSGVVFYGEPNKGYWTDRLDVSDRFIDPLFRAVLDRAWAESGGELVPRLASDWNTLEGWAGCAIGVTEVAGRDAEDLMAAFGEVTAADLDPHVAGASVEDCLRCAGVIREFVRERLARGRLFIDD